MSRKAGNPFLRNKEALAGPALDFNELTVREFNYLYIAWKDHGRCHHAKRLHARTHPAMVRKGYVVDGRLTPEVDAQCDAVFGWDHKR